MDRVSVARVITKPIPDRIMMESGTTTNIKPYADKVEKTTSNVKIAITKMKCVSEVSWQGADGTGTVLIIEKLIALVARISLPSIPKLAKKNVGVLFLSGKAILFDTITIICNGL